MKETSLLPIAVYGTLRRGERAYRWLRLHLRARHLGGCEIEGVLYDMGRYPAFRPSGGRVKADLFEILDPALMAELDAYEGYDPAAPERSLYLRQRVRLIRPPRDAWVYVYNGEPKGKPQIESGDWLASRQTAGRAE